MTGDELRNSNHTMATLRKYYKKETMERPFNAIRKLEMIKLSWLL